MDSRLGRFRGLPGFPNISDFLPTLSQYFSEDLSSRYRLPNAPFIIIFLAFKSNLIFRLRARIPLYISLYIIALYARAVTYISLTEVYNHWHFVNLISHLRFLLRPYHIKLLHSIFALTLSIPFYYTLCIPYVSLGCSESGYPNKSYPRA